MNEKRNGYAHELCQHGWSAHCPHNNCDGGTQPPETIGEVNIPEDLRARVTLLWLAMTAADSEMENLLHGDGAIRIPSVLYRQLGHAFDAVALAGGLLGDLGKNIRMYEETLAQLKSETCDKVSNADPRVACGYKAGHASPHSWDSREQARG